MIKAFLSLWLLHLPGTPDGNLITDLVDNIVITKPKSISSPYKSRSGRRRRGRRQHLCLDKGYKSEQEQQELIKRSNVLQIPIKKKEVNRRIMNKNQK